MNSTISPETLKSLRTGRNLTQAQLAERISCSSAQVSRWERGKNLRLRSDLREKLAKALRVEWEILTRPPSDIPDDEEIRLFPKEQLNVRVGREKKTALELVCLRYGVKPSTVVDLAPLLFLITAENSLRAREETMNAAWSHMSDASDIAMPHLGKYVFYGSWEDRTSEEKQSIAERDIFAKTLDGWGWENWDEDSDCPYTNYLHELAADLIKGGEVVANISPNYGDAPDYEVALDTFREVTGIDDSTESGERLRSLILIRHIKLQAVITKRQELDKDDFDIWLKEALNEAEEQIVDDVKSFFHDANIDINDLKFDDQEEVE